MGRSEWIGFIQAHALRYLYASKAEKELGSSTDDAEVRAFLERLGRLGDRRLLLRLSYLTDPEAVRFFRTDLPALLRALSHEVTRRLDVSRGVIRGKVAWGQTVARQAGRRGSAPEYVVRVPERSADLPETRLLRLFLAQTREAVLAAEVILGTSSLPDDVAFVKRSAEAGLKDANLREAGGVRQASALMRQRAFRRRDPSWGRLARLQMELDRAVLRERWESVLELLRRGWLAPLDDDDVFELYVLILFLSVLEKEAGFDEAEFFGLVRPGRGEVAVLRHGQRKVRVRVHFDQGPGALLGQTASRYSSVLGHYAVQGRSHRPDVTAVFEAPQGRRRVLIVEIKRSEDGSYLRNSIYKMFGYFYDFAGLWEGLARTDVRGVLVFPEDVEPKDREARLLEDLVLVGAGDRESIARAVELALP